jgi:hypothetical protein
MRTIENQGVPFICSVHSSALMFFQTHSSISPEFISVSIFGTSEIPMLFVCLLLTNPPHPSPPLLSKQSLENTQTGKIHLPPPQTHLFGASDS